MVSRHAFDIKYVFNLQVSMQEETIVPKQNLPPLLVPVSERLQERIFYIGASFGLTTELFSFWKKHEFLPLHISQNPVTTQIAFIFLIYFYIWVSHLLSLLLPFSVC